MGISGRHHVAGVYDGKAMMIYLDGVLQARRAQTGEITASTGVPLMFGSSPSDPERTFEGSIDGAQVYRRALVAGEIVAAYEAGNLAKENVGPDLVYSLPLAPMAVSLPVVARVAGGIMITNVICGGKFADVIISDAFGYSPDGRTVQLRDATALRGFTGTLRGLVFKGSSYTVSSRPDGLSIVSGVP
jgi:hypothetical protein